MEEVADVATADEGVAIVVLVATLEDDEVVGTLDKSEELLLLLLFMDKDLATSSTKDNILRASR